MTFEACPVLSYRDYRTQTCLPDERAIWLWGPIAPDSIIEWLISVVPTSMIAFLVLFSTVCRIISICPFLHCLVPARLVRLANDPRYSSFLQCFDMLRTTKDLFAPREAKSRTGVLDPWRIVAILWVFLNHLGSEGMVAVLEGSPAAGPYKDSIHSDLFYGPLLGNSALGVEIFLALSGLLSAKAYKPDSPSPPLAQLVAYAVKRMIRFHLIIFGFLIISSSAPLRHFLPLFSATMVAGCGWSGILSHLVFMGNYQSMPTCYGYLWYVSLDLQMHCLIVIPLLWGLTHRRERTLKIAFAAVIVSIFLRVWDCTHYQICNRSDVDIPFVHIASLSGAEIEGMYRGIWPLYSRLLTKSGPFIMGIVLAVEESRKRKISRRESWLLFLGGAVMAGATIWAILPEYWYPEMGTNYYNAIYTGVFRNVFALAILMMIASSILLENPCSVWKWRVWSAASKLCFSAYLCHMPAAYIFNADEQFQKVMGGSELIKYLPSHIGYTFIAALLFYFFIEAPLTRVAQTISARIFPQTHAHRD